MEKRDMFKDRERALEEVYFHAQDARLIERLRARATFGELALALKEKLEVDDPTLLERIRDLGFTRETGAALLAAPLVEVAWADGVVTERERGLVLELAASRGIEEGSAAHGKIVEWLEHRPEPALFETALETIGAGLSVLTPAEKDERVRLAVEACHRVAAASGGFLALFGLPGEVSEREAAVLERIAARLHEGAWAGR